MVLSTSSSSEAQLQAAWNEYSQGRVHAAASTLHRLATDRPDAAASWHLLGAMFWQEDSVLAERCLRRAIALDPSSVSALNALAATLKTAGRGPEVLPLLRTALALLPGDIATLGNLAALSRPTSIEWSLRILHMQPDNTEARLDLAKRFLIRGDAEAAAGTLDREISGSPALHAARISVSYLLERETAKDTLALATDFDRRFARPLATVRRHRRDHSQRLRIGYVLSDGFRLHTAAVTMLPLIEGHDRDKVDAYCYSDVPAAGRDSITDRFIAASTFRDMAGRDDATFATAIADDRIDAVIDTHGYASGSRLLALARRPARVNICWPPMGSLGLDAVQVIFGDRRTIPPGTESDFSERVVRVPFAFHYDPLVATPEAAMPRPRDIVFGSFNQRAKLSPKTIRMWSRILAAEPRSRLVLKAGAFAAPEVADDVRDAFAKVGIDRSRIECRSHSTDMWSHLASYADIDIALDPSPYGGVITTLEALWMGVPVVTLIGDRLLGRYGHAFVDAVGLPELAAADEDAYVATAVGLATDHQRRTALRGGMRARMLGSPLCDAEALATNIESAVRGLLAEPWVPRD